MSKTLRSPQHLFLCEQLKKARIDAGLTQSELAERIGKPQSYVAKVETHERRLDVVEFTGWMVACNAKDVIGEVLEALVSLNLSQAAESQAILTSRVHD